MIEYFGMFEISRVNWKLKCEFCEFFGKLKLPKTTKKRDTVTKMKSETSGKWTTLPKWDHGLPNQDKRGS